MTTAARVEVIVLHYNHRPLLERCLAALEAQSFREFAVTVIDNASTDDSVPWLRTARPGVRLHANACNLGFAAAYDEYLRGHSTADLVALLNNDAFPDPGWLAALVAALDADPGVAAVTSRIRFDGDPGMLNHAGGGISPLGSGFDIGFGLPDGPAFDAPRDCGAPSGAACLIRRADYLAAGGFDPAYFAWFEDVDLGWRLWLRGRRVAYVPTATVAHAYGATGGKRGSTLRIYHCQKNRLANATKHLALPRLAFALWAGLAFDAWRSVAALVAGDGLATVGAVVRGYWAWFRWLPALIRQRRAIQRDRVVSDRDLRRQGALAGWRTAARAFRDAGRYRAGGSRPDDISSQCE